MSFDCEELTSAVGAGIPIGDLQKSTDLSTCVFILIVLYYLLNKVRIFVQYSVQTADIVYIYANVYHRVPRNSSLVTLVFQLVSADAKQD
jgi:hypothetical protein